MEMQSVSGIIVDVALTCFITCLWQYMIFFVKKDATVGIMGLFLIGICDRQICMMKDNLSLEDSEQFQDLT